LQLYAELIAECLFEAANQHFDVQWLAEEAYRAAGHGHSFEVRFGKSCYHDDGECFVALTKSLVKLEAVHSRHLDFCDRARKSTKICVCEKLFGRRETKSIVSK